MKGLVLKDLYEARFSMIMGALIAIYPNLLFCICDQEFFFGDRYTMSAMSTIFYGFLSYVTVVPFSSLLINNLDSEKESGWLKIQRTMPVSGEQTVLAKVISTAICTGIFTLISLIFNIIGIFTNENTIPEVMIALPICFGVMEMLILPPVFPVSVKLGSKKAGFIYLGMLIAVSVLLFMALRLFLMNNMSVVIARIAVYGVLPAAAAAVIILSSRTGRNLIAKDI